MANWSRQWVIKCDPDEPIVGQICEVTLRNGGTQHVMIEAVGTEIHDDEDGEYVLAIGHKVKKV
jgi:hypothetical protein